MNLDIIDTKNAKKSSAALPVQFREEVRPDLIKRAFEFYMSHARQAYGSDPEAGKRASVAVSRRRRAYRGSYGIGISRVPRKVMSRRGRRMNWVGAFASGMRGGRRAHPPKAEKIWAQKLNTQERKKSIRSAIAATVQKAWIAPRYQVPEHYPIILDKSFEDLARTSEVQESLVMLGLAEELERSSKRKIRAGRGKMRNRRYQRKVGPLFVVGKECKLLKSAANLPGVDVVQVSELNVLHLAPGAQPGRIVYFTQPAIEVMAQQKLFMAKARRKIALPVAAAPVAETAAKPKGRQQEKQ